MNVLKESKSIRSRKFPYFILLIPQGKSKQIEDYLWQDGTLGFEEISSDDNLVMLKVYFDTESKLENCKKNINSLITEAIVIHSGEVDYTDWESFLHGGFEPFAVGPLMVVPAENPPPIPDEYKPLYIIPGRGFGTGSHPSTYMCLHLLAESNVSGQRIFDVGTGSGILAIAACLLGADSALAAEIDADSIINARENAEFNKMSDRIDFRKGSLEVAGNEQFPTVCVNIIAKVVSAMFDDGLANLVEPGGMVITSGILNEEADDLSKKVESFGFSPEQRLGKGEWTAFAFRKSTL